MLYSTSASSSHSSGGDPVLFTLSSSNGFTLQTSAITRGMKYSKSANYDYIDILNRSGPIITYKNSSLATFDVTLKLVALAGSNDLLKMYNIVSSLMSLVLSTNPGVAPTTVCSITVGSGILLNNWQCVCHYANPSFGEENMWIGGANGGAGADAMSLDIDCQFGGLELQNIPASQYLIEGSYMNLAF